MPFAVEHDGGHLHYTCCAVAQEIRQESGAWKADVDAPPAVFREQALTRLNCNLDSALYPGATPGSSLGSPIVRLAMLALMMLICPRTQSR